MNVTPKNGGMKLEDHKIISANKSKADEEFQKKSLKIENSKKEEKRVATNSTCPSLKSHSK